MGYNIGIEMTMELPMRRIDKHGKNDGLRLGHIVGNNVGGVAGIKVGIRGGNTDGFLSGL